MSDVRFLPTSFLPAIPADAATMQQTMTRELIRIQVFKRVRRV
jgi:hypothetical protein